MSASSRSTLYLYTVYDHPADYPQHFVVRKFAIGPGTVTQTDDVQLYESLPLVWRAMMDQGLVCLPRSTDDDPKIVETWM